VSGLRAPATRVYRRHQPETTALYEVVRDNLETLYGAIDDGSLAVRIPKHARKELLAYLDWRGVRPCSATCCARLSRRNAFYRPDGLVRITVKKAYTDGTVAVDMDKAVAALPPGHERAYAALPHRALRGRARGRQPVEAPHRAEGARGGAGRGERAARPNGAGRPLPSVGGAALRARSPWTSSAVPPVTDA